MIFQDKNLVWGFSKKQNGPMKFTPLRPKSQVEKNRRDFFKKLSINLKEVVSAGQNHGKKISIVNKRQAGKFVGACDGLVTSEKNLILTITAADCLPIYFFNKEKKVIGLVHAGWKGVLLNISKEVIKVFKKRFDIEARDVRVYIGPHIKKCHFEVGKKDINKFRKYKETIQKRKEKYFVDLTQIAICQLKEAGVNKKNIKVSPHCTYCEGKKYYSFRRDKPDEVEAQIAYIGLK